MSRSYRHDMSNMPACRKDTSRKKAFNRKIRRTTKNVLDMPGNMAYRRMNPSWEICDYRCDCRFENLKGRWMKNFGISEGEAEALWKRHERSK